MQSIRRMIKRGNAVITINSATDSLELIQSNRVDAKTWRDALKNRSQLSEQSYAENITLPLSHNDVISSSQRFVFVAPTQNSNSRKGKKNRA